MITTFFPRCTRRVKGVMWVFVSLGQSKPTTLMLLAVLRLHTPRKSALSLFTSKSEGMQNKNGNKQKYALQKCKQAEVYIP